MAAIHYIDGNVSISQITLRLGEHSRRFKEAGLAINSRRTRFKWREVGKSMLGAFFNPPLVLSSEDHLSIFVCHSYGSGKFNLLSNNQEIKISASDLLTAVAQRGFEGLQEWRQLFGKEEVIIHFSSAVRTLAANTPLFAPSSIFSTRQPSSSSELVLTKERLERELPPIPIPLSALEAPSSSKLVPVTEAMRRDSPRFRILVAGKTGVGKSSLINAAFGVQDAQISNYVPGQAEIDREITSKTNPNFVVHDSRGFEPGDETNLDELLQFVKTRNAKPDPKDRLHAIWLCFAAPIAGGRLMETGVEKILKLKRDGELGDVPVIVVLTKFDGLVNKERRGIVKTSGKTCSPTDIARLATEKANKTVKEDCIEPLKKEIGVDLVHMIISTKASYENTLQSLIQLTFEHVKEHGRR